MFNRSGSAWTQTAKLTASDGAAGDFFGGSLSVSGPTAVVGAEDATVGGSSNAGATYVFGTPVAASKLAFTTQPSNTAVGAGITPAVQVSVEDANGNVVTSDSSNVTVAIGANPGSGTLGGTRTVAAINGVATFSNLSINKVGTGYTLTAADGTLTGATSSTFNIAQPQATLVSRSITDQNGAPNANDGSWFDTIESDGSYFSQTFTLKNTGTTPWDGYYLVHVTGSDSLGGQDSILISPTDAGHSVKVTVKLEAIKSLSPGAAQLAYWEIRNGPTVNGTTAVTISGTSYLNSYAANKLWTAITINPKSGKMAPNLAGDGYNSKINPYFPAFGGQCTAFVWGRVYEKLGIALRQANGSKWTMSAGQAWINALGKLGYGPPDSTPSANSIAVWSGHVAFVEDAETTVVKGKAITSVKLNEANCYHYPGFAYTDDPQNTAKSKIGWGDGYDGSVTGWLSPQTMTTWLDSVGENFLGYIHLTPQPPTNLAATNGVYTNEVRLTWTPSANANAYEVWRNTSNNIGTATKISSSDVKGTAYDDRTAVAGTRYWYWVKAKNAAGTSGVSAGVQGYRGRLSVRVPQVPSIPSISAKIP